MEAPNTSTPTLSVQDLWDSAIHIIQATEHHSFLIDMVHGTLPLSQFQYYVVQDAYYLKDFADSLRRLAEKAKLSKESESDAAQLLEFAIGAEQAEMSLHHSFFKEWNINPSATTTSTDIHTQMPNTLLYTSYIKQIVTTRPYAEGLSSLLPCFWVYAHVGDILLELRTKLGTTVTRPPMYDAWINMYGGEDFQTHVSDYKALVDTALRNISPTDATTYPAMRQHFVMACQLEHMFWDQALTCMTWPAIGVQETAEDKIEG
jgi:thiaminase (transcriptional activator TenA)